jgi:hypothetical protein
VVGFGNSQLPYRQSLLMDNATSVPEKRRMGAPRLKNVNCTISKGYKFMGSKASWLSMAACFAPYTAERPF